MSNRLVCRILGSSQPSSLGIVVRVPPMSFSKPVVCGPSFFNLGALFPVGLAVDDAAVLQRVDAWRSRVTLVSLFVRNTQIAHSKGFHLHLRKDIMSRNGRIRGKGPRIPDWGELDPGSWLTQEYIRRFLHAREDISAAALAACDSLLDQSNLFSLLPGWSSTTADGVVVRVFPGRNNAHRAASILRCGCYQGEHCSFIFFIHGVVRSSILR